MRGVVARAELVGVDGRARHVREEKRQDDAEGGETEASCAIPAELHRGGIMHVFRPANSDAGYFFSGRRKAGGLRVFFGFGVKVAGLRACGSVAGCRLPVACGVSACGEVSGCELLVASGSSCFWFGNANMSDGPRGAAAASVAGCSAGC